MIRYWTYGRLSLLHGRYAKHRFAPHFHDAYSIAVILSGALAFKRAGDSHCAEPATISAVDPGEVHTGQPGAASGWEYLHFFVPPDVLQELVPELQAPLPEIGTPVIQDAATARLLIAAYRAIARDSADLEKDVALALARAFGALFMAHADVPAALDVKRASRASTRLAEDYIRAHFAEQIRLADLAAAVGVSPYHFLRTFAQDTGLTPLGYQQQVRVSFGLRRLREGAPSAQAANDAGYADQSHFTRALKRTYGVTPSLVQRAA